MIRDQEILNQLLDTVSRYVRERLVPIEAQVAEENAIPEDVIEEMKEMGLFGMTIPEQVQTMVSARPQLLLKVLKNRRIPTFQSTPAVN